MSEQQALAFIRQARTKAIDVSALSPQTTTLSDVVDFAKEQGFDFTEDEFRMAFKRDWGERWLQRSRNTIPIERNAGR